MKVIFEFDANNEDFDKFKFERIKRADEMAQTLISIVEQLRTWNNNNKERPSIPTKEIHEKIWDIIQKNDICLDDLWRIVI